MPARYAALVDSGKISADQMANLPPADVLAKVSFLTADQVAKANTVLQENWAKMVTDA